MGFYQLFIDRHLETETIERIVGEYFAPDRTITYFSSKDEMLERWFARGNKPLDIDIIIEPLSEAYPLLLEIWQPGPDSLADERHFAIFFSKAADCRSIITDEERNPYS